MATCASQLLCNPCCCCECNDVYGSYYKENVVLEKITTKDFTTSLSTISSSRSDEQYLSLNAKRSLSNPDLVYYCKEAKFPVIQDSNDVYRISLKQNKSVLSLHQIQEELDENVFMTKNITLTVSVESFVPQSNSSQTDTRAIELQNPFRKISMFQNGSFARKCILSNVSVEPKLTLNLPKKDIEAIKILSKKNLLPIESNIFQHELKFHLNGFQEIIVPPKREFIQEILEHEPEVIRINNSETCNPVVNCTNKYSKCDLLEKNNSRELKNKIIQTSENLGSDMESTKQFSCQNESLFHEAYEFCQKLNETLLNYSIEVPRQTQSFLGDTFSGQESFSSITSTSSSSPSGYSTPERYAC